MPLPLDYHSGLAAPRKAVTTVAVGCVAVLVVVVNSVLLAAVKTDSPNGSFGGWADVAVLTFLAPVSNGFLLAMALAFAPLVKRTSRGRPIAGYVVASILLPAAAYAADFVLITGGFLR